ncbi:hypothetical protein [Nonomuraea sp. NPDC049695]
MGFPPQHDFPRPAAEQADAAAAIILRPRRHHGLVRSCAAEGRGRVTA